MNARLLGVLAAMVALLGAGLHISQLNLEEGKVTVEGHIAALEYGDAPSARRGLLSRVFR